ncbi:MAG: LuxR C-terminal-related transcriptional regulator [Pseudolysinimonas sp.]
MDALRPRDFRSVLDAVYALNLVDRIDDLPLAVAKLAYELVPCDHAAWAVIDFAAGGMETVHWPHDIADRVRQLPAELALVPLVPAAAMGPTSTVIRLSDFHTTREWHAMPIYSELYRPTGIEYQIVVPVGFAAPSSGVRGKRAESFTLGRWDSDFTDRERAILDEFGRHVRSAARRLRMMPIDPSSELAARFRLTGRQLESLLAVADGATVDAAARGLGLSPKTLENHLQAAYLRLGVNNRTAALARLRGNSSSRFAVGEIPL